MKPKIYPFLFFFISVLLITNCKKDDEPVEQILTTIELSAPSTNIVIDGPGETLQITPEAFDQNKDPMINVTFSWSSSNTAVATVNNAGLVVLNKTGTTTIKATSGSISGSLQITVTETANLNSIVVTSPIESTYLGISDDQVQLEAMSYDQFGNAFQNVSYQWSTSDDNIATVDQNGLVTLLSSGDVEITAQANNISGTVSLSILGRNKAGKTVFVNVSVIDVMSGTVLPAKDVYVIDDFIESITDTGSQTIPSDATEIDATGKFIMPGLGDAHVHVFFETDFYQYLANSVTSIIDMGNSSAATPEQSPALDWKFGVIDGSLEGPNFYPSVLVRGIGNGRVANNAEEARAIVDIWHEYDFIKSYSFVPEDAFDALLSHGQNYGINVIGHANRNIGMTEVLSRGQKMIAHAEEYLYTHFNGQTTDALIDDAVSKTLNAGAYVTGTLSTYEAISKVWNLNTAGYDELKLRPGVEFTNPAYKPGWDNQFNNVYNQPGSIESGLDFQLVYIKRFHDAGIPILLGTDSPRVIGLPSGFSIHEDMRLLSQAGISNADILRIGTSNFGEFIKRDSRNKEDFGQVAVGYRADLVLLDTNPISDLSTLRTPVGVMVRGKWYSREYLNEQLEKLRN